jgi:hypothetical protein
MSTYYNNNIIIQHSGHDEGEVCRKNKPVRALSEFELRRIIAEKLKGRKVDIKALISQIRVKLSMGMSQEEATNEVIRQAAPEKSEVVKQTFQPEMKKVWKINYDPLKKELIEILNNPRLAQYHAEAQRLLNEILLNE